MALLQDARIERIVDVRKIPMSRANPQFNRNSLPEALAAYQISYDYEAALGGLRRKADDVPPDLNGYWDNQSFHNYADYGLSDSFREGLDHVMAEGQKRRCAVMCSEAVWWRCHRRLIADNLLAHGKSVFHIMALGRIEAANLTHGAVIRPDSTVIYPAIVGDAGQAGDHICS